MPDLHTSPAFRYMRSVCRGNTISTFKQLLQCVLSSWSRGSPNIHWQPVLENCEVCSLHYEYISESTFTLNVAELNRHIMYTADVGAIAVRVENMMEEGGYVLRKAGFSDGDAIMSTVRNQTIRDSEKSKHKSTGEYYRDIPQDMIDSLRDMYKHEILLFGYPDTPFE